MTTQKAEALVSSTVKNTSSVNYDVRLALHFIQDQVYRDVQRLSLSSVVLMMASVAYLVRYIVL